MKAAKRGVCLLAGTRKGAFLFRSDLRRRSWKIEGPFFAGQEINHFMRDAHSGRLYCAVHSAWWGSDLQVSSNAGKTWRKSSAGLQFAPDRGLTLNRIWHVAAHPARPETLLCGVDPGALFRSDDAGKNWREVAALTGHPTRSRWQPGAGGLCLHTILFDTTRPERIYVAISAAGCFRSDDDGENWQPLNKGVRADFLPGKFPEVGQCVHKMVLHPSAPEVIFQQNHCGVYRSENAAEDWKDISKGLPSRFGFPMCVHPHEPKTIYVVPEIGAEKRYVPDGRFSVWRSRDGGRKWQELTRGLPQEHAYLQVLRDSATTDSCEEAGVYMGTNTGEIFYSRDSGDSWNLLHAHLPAVMSLEAYVV
jgi:photosystem II stability/assembly factor-like uncharacterized protein